MLHLRFESAKYKYATYIDRYFDIVGRLAALLVGTIAIDMIVTGVVGLIDQV